MSGRKPGPSNAAARPGWLARLFGAGRGGPRATSDPALLLAHDWLLARGGRVRRIAADLVEGMLPDGTVVRYTCSPQRARQDPGVDLLAPGTPDWAALRGDLAERAAGRVYRVGQAPADAEALVRATFAPPAAGCTRCTQDADVSGRGPLCVACPLRQGQVVVAGVGAVRGVTVERTDEHLAYEYSFRFRVASAQGEREEIVRVAVDAATGERLAPLDMALLVGAKEAQHASTGVSDRADGPRARMEDALRLIEPAAEAAARLARAQALPEYQRRQDDVAATFERLLVEDPSAGREALSARERALERLAEAHAVGLETQLVAATSLLTPLVAVRTRFGGGAETRAEVDPCRQTVMPRCVVCGSAWRVGARCGEGHLTCLACQERCMHCGARRCAQCATAPYVACGVCGAATCASCSRATARGRHRVMSAPSAAAMPAKGVGQPNQPEHDTEAGPDDLSVADLDSMTPATWRACVVWLLNAMSYAVERDLDGAGTDLAFVCRALSEGEHKEAVNGAGLAARQVVAFGYRPTARVPGDLVPANTESARTLAGRVQGARALLLTTAREEGRASPDVEVVDRARLAAWLADRRAAHQHARAAAAATMDERAAAAGRVRAILMAGLAEAETQLAARAETSSVEHRTEDDQIARVEAHAATARQALAALETLIAQWEAAFAPMATRDSTQAITATAGEFGTLAERAGHLLGVLRDACTAIAADGKRGGPEEWLMALCDELGERCQALATRVEALNPDAWRVFAAVRDGEAARASVEHEAASQRASARARAVRDTLTAPGPRPRRRAQGAVSRKRL